MVPGRIAVLAAGAKRGKIGRHSAVWYAVTRADAPTKGGPVEEERERVKAGMADEADVEAHKHKAGIAEGSEAPDQETGRRESDEPDVEAHKFKAG
jgi:hypothetical protein